MKREVVKNNNNFDPLPHIEELTNNEIYNEGGVKPATLLNLFCDRRMTAQKYYQPIWDKLNEFQKMKIAIKNKFYVIDDLEEIYSLFSKYPFQLSDYIKYKMIQERNLFKGNIDPEICLSEIENEKDRELAYRIFKMFGLIDYEDLIKMKKEMSLGNGVFEVTFSKELQKYFPSCIVKVKDDLNINPFSKKL